MAKHKRSDDWGFPRWRSYGDKGRSAAKVRLCDRAGCNEMGDRPAPKAPNSPERWYFCETHAAEYNKNWNYFEGLSAEEAAAREAEERRDAGERRVDHALRDHLAHALDRLAALTRVGAGAVDPADVIQSDASTHRS